MHGVHSISKNAWGIIAHELSVQDLIQLRGTCRWLNNVVQSMNARWYRAHQWFVARNGAKRNVKSAVRCHTAALRGYCIPLSHAKLQGMSWREKQIAIQSGMEKGVFTEADCDKRLHWKYKVPEREQDIPLDKGYKPKRNCYMFWYLIEVYRHKKKDVKERITAYNGALVDCQRQREQNRWAIKRLQEEIAASHVREQELHVKRDAAIAVHQANDIFEGVRINCYKGSDPKKK